ncbi:MAG TPA: UDP-N-acetylglucosamine 2-epimerase, partial [Puia sp.]|nr:UDP-N-acetylglucosamine 2-epimerase [Puia sp.]
MTIAHIVGNRPQFIKLALLQRALSRHAGWRSRIIHTGQHFSDNMSAIFFREFGLPAPDHQLKIHSLSHNEMIGQMLIALDT